MRKKQRRNNANSMQTSATSPDSTTIRYAVDRAAGNEIILITWFHQTDRNILKLHPRGDRNRPLTGVFATRSPDRPNPLGLHRVTVLEIVGDRLRVEPIEAIDDTAIVDIKAVLSKSVDS